MTAPMHHPLTATDLDGIERRARSGQAIRCDVALRLLADFRQQRALNDALLGSQGGWSGGGIRVRVTQGSSDDRDADTGAGVPAALEPPAGGPGAMAGRGAR